MADSDKIWYDRQCRDRSCENVVRRGSVPQRTQQLPGDDVRWLESVTLGGGLWVSVRNVTDVLVGRRFPTLRSVLAYVCLSPPKAEDPRGHDSV
jgi:hypothetical protein